ncbi:hypothetical protein CEXT_465271 [Caerostris extrusa]|uniref:Uncharacterized protein n=1 Tax=Caerostris extrusa TaxID=172846 RepID=A0AAV4PC20_CAEEX|nr:hypothetical protein CEXT_465271 [Caerostris extrusa]
MHSVEGKKDQTMHQIDDWFARYLVNFANESFRKLLVIRRRGEALILIYIFCLKGRRGRIIKGDGPLEQGQSDMDP